MTIGIYEIWIGDYYYQGRSVRIEYRAKEHLWQLERGIHRNTKMQNVFNKYKTFEYQVLVECQKSECEKWEQDFIDTNWGDKFYLNCMKSSAGGWEHVNSKVMSVETRAKHSLRTKGKAKRLVTCPRCGKIGGNGVMQKWHFHNCNKGDSI